MGSNPAQRIYILLCFINFFVLNIFYFQSNFFSYVFVWLKTQVIRNIDSKNSEIFRISKTNFFSYVFVWLMNSLECQHLTIEVECHLIQIHFHFQWVLMNDIVTTLSLLKPFTFIGIYHYNHFLLLFYSNPGHTLRHDLLI